MACVVILMENCISYPELVILSDGEIAFNVVDIPLRTLASLKKSTDNTRLLGLRKKLAQVLNVPGIRTSLPSASVILYDPGLVTLVTMNGPSHLEYNLYSPVSS